MVAVTVGVQAEVQQAVMQAGPVVPVVRLAGEAVGLEGLVQAQGA